MTETKNIKKYFGFFTDFFQSGFKGALNFTKSEEEQKKTKSEIQTEKELIKKKKGGLDVEKNEIDAKIKFIQTKLATELLKKEQLIEKKANGETLPNDYERDLKKIDDEIEKLNKEISTEQEKLTKKSDELTEIKRAEYNNWYQEGINNGSWLFFGVFYFLWLFVIWTIYKVIKKVFIFISGILF